MKPLVHDDFLLITELGRQLYHQHAASQPIIDYHSHVDAGDLAADRSFTNLAQLWVTSDPYKHRAMRIAGVPEAFITGPASDEEKFLRWADTVPQLLGNPLYHWTALELKRYFNISTPLNPGTAKQIWNDCNDRLGQAAFTARGLLTQRNVECVCTSDRLLDDLSSHAALAKCDFATRVLPSLRADDILAIDTADFCAWAKRLGQATGITIEGYASFGDAVARRLDAFQALGCRLADHALDDFTYVSVGESQTAALFDRVLTGSTLNPAEAVALRSGMLRQLGTDYARRGLILQLHLGAQRRTSTRLRNLAGPAGGFASIGNSVDIQSLCAFLDDLEKAGALPRTILYPLNPVDFPSMAVLGGSFAEDGVRGKIQLGPAWWFNDHAGGMRAQLEAVASHGLLSVFVGMTTDSRSLLSMTRHEYFRRLFCDWVGEQAVRGAFPDDLAQLGQLVEAICYENPRRALSL